MILLPSLFFFFFFTSSPPLPILFLLSAAASIALAFQLHASFCSRRRRLNPPPGSMGWPYVGETLQLYSQNPDTFFASRQKRYGSDIFKSHILGCPCVMMASPEAAKLVLMTQASLFRPTFPASKMALIGRNALFFHEGAYHARLRKLVLAAFAPQSIRCLVHDIEKLVVATLESWPFLQQHSGFVNTFAEMKKFSFKVGMLRIFGSLKNLDVDALNLAYTNLEKGYNSMPISVPTTKYYESTKARRRLHAMIHGIIEQRRADKIVRNDFLDTLMACKEVTCDGVEVTLSDEQIIDNIIGIIFASRDTTASVLTWIIKFLGNNPTLLQSVVDEHEKIQHSKVKEGKDQYELTWDDTKNMQLTARVMQETMRIVSILSFTFREAIQDVEYKGYIIPKGWKVLPLFRNIHHNPEFFDDPLSFNPSRFEVPPKPNSFLPFGSGMHSCPGSELAKLEILIFIHHLTTKLRWKSDESKIGTQYSPFQIPMDGLPIQVMMKQLAHFESQ